MKAERQLKILELIEKHTIETQGELTRLLREAGFNTTQATISRDIRELNLIKDTDKTSGRQKYCTIPEDEKISERLLRVFKDGIVSMSYAQNMIVIKTFSGMGMVVATALDAMNNSEILGTIAGDDTVFAVSKSEHSAARVIERFKNVVTDTVSKEINK